MPSYGFCFRASERKGGGAGRLYLRVVHGGESRSVTTEHRILPEEWDASRRRLIIPYNHSSRSRELALIESSLLGAVGRMARVVELLEGENPHASHYTIDRLMAHYRDLTVGNTFCALAERLASGLDHDGYRRTADNPFAGVYTGTAPTRKRALSQADLATLSSLDPTVTEGRPESQHLPEPLGRALAMFLFCYHARGMCFVDMANLKKSDLRGNTIRYRRVKTGQSIELKVLPAMRRIIEWFAPRTVGSRYLFPVITDPEGDVLLQYESGLRIQNIRLKRIAALCGITVCISTHVARHSWATVARNAGLSLAIISEGLGHTHQRTTEIYLASLERSIIDRASQMVSEAILVHRPGKSKKMPGVLGGSGGLPGYVAGGFAAWR